MDVEKLLKYVFELPAAEKAPAFTSPLPEHARGLVDRYLLCVDDLHDSSLLTQDQGYTVRVSGGVEEVTREEFLSRELSRGVAITIRQLHSSDEPASFEKICDALFVHMKGEPADVQDRGRPVVAAWRDAHNKLNGRPLMQFARKKAQSQGKYPPGPIEFGHELAPEKLMSRYLYGDLVHWGRKRDELAAAAAEPAVEVAHRMNFMEAMLVFIHVYIGFAKVVEAMTGPTR